MDLRYPIVRRFPIDLVSVVPFTPDFTTAVCIRPWRKTTIVTSRCGTALRVGNHIGFALSLHLSLSLSRASRCRNRNSTVHPFSTYYK